MQTIRTLGQVYVCLAARLQRHPGQCTHFARTKTKPFGVTSLDSIKFKIYFHSNLSVSPSYVLGACPHSGDLALLKWVNLVQGTTEESSNPKWVLISILKLSFV